MRQPISGGKAKKAASSKPMAAAKKPVRQVETSMSAKYKGTPKVSQATIDSIKKMGMTAALKKAGSSKNPEYLEGIKRMYGAKRLAAAKGGMSKPVAKKATRSFSPAQKKAMGYVAPKTASGANNRGAKRAI